MGKLNIDIPQFRLVYETFNSPMGKLNNYKKGVLFKEKILSIPLWVS